MLTDIALSAVVALAVSACACAALVRFGPKDLPGAPHKAHRAPTPTSGGIGIMLGFLVGLLALDAFMPGGHVSAAGVVFVRLSALFACAFFLLGVVDDARPLGPRLKFAVFTALSLAAAATLGVVRTLPIGDGAALELAYAVALFGTALWIFTLVNCVNFMDGANGLAMGSIAVGLCTLGYIAIAEGARGGAALSVCGAAALLGFLLWNFPFGRLFAGDSGSLFAGALAAIASLVVIHRVDLHPAVPPIIFFPLLADALLTLASRASNRRSLLEGHSEHLYQVALRGGWSHARVALTYWVLMAVCGALGVWLVQSGDDRAPWLALAALAIVSIVFWIPVRAAAKKRGILEI